MYRLGQDHWPGLSKVQEEMAELGVVLAKLVERGSVENYWDGRDLEGELHDEIADVENALQVFCELNALNRGRIAWRKNEKYQKLIGWHHEGDDYIRVPTR